MSSNTQSLLETMPSELLDKIIDKLDKAKDVEAMQLVCRRFDAIIKAHPGNLYWKKLYQEVAKKPMHNANVGYKQAFLAIARAQLNNLSQTSLFNCHLPAVLSNEYGFWQKAVKQHPSNYLKAPVDVKLDSALLKEAITGQVAKTYRQGATLFDEKAAQLLAPLIAIAPLLSLLVYIIGTVQLSSESQQQTINTRGASNF
jgi:hypothetical protein